MSSYIPLASDSPVTPLTVSADSIDLIEGDDSIEGVDSIDAREFSLKLGRGTWVGATLLDPLTTS